MALSDACFEFLRSLRLRPRVSRRRSITILLRRSLLHMAQKSTRFARPAPRSGLLPSTQKLERFF